MHGLIKKNSRERAAACEMRREGQREPQGRGE